MKVKIITISNKVKVCGALVGKERHDILKEVNKKLAAKKQFEGSLFHKLKFYFRSLLIPEVPFSFLFFTIIFNVSQYYLILIAIKSFVFY